MTNSPNNIVNGKYLHEVISTARRQIVHGDLADYIPIPTGLHALDGIIGGGMRKNELILLGGPQGVGKTIVSLQIAKMIASRPGYTVYYLCFEHSEEHLLNRLLCLESVNAENGNIDNGLTMRELYKLTETIEGKSRSDRGLWKLQDVLADNPKTAYSLNQMSKYSNTLVLRKGSSSNTTIAEIREAVTSIKKSTSNNVVVFIDYLQKIAVEPSAYRNDSEKVTVITESLKDMAMTLEVPVWAVVAADREGLKAKRMHLYHLRGSSALDYECDIAIIMHNKYNILSKANLSYATDPAKWRNWVIFTIEKNRAGEAFKDAEFEIFGRYFCIGTTGNREIHETLIDERTVYE